MHTSKHWLRQISWDHITQIHTGLCQNKNVAANTNPQHDTARHLWEKALPKELSLIEAIEVCRKCNDLLPFTFNSGNTFASVGAQLVRDWTPYLPALEKHMLETAIGHYVNGKIGKSELKTTLRHLESVIEKNPTPMPQAPTPPPIVSTSSQRHVPA